jgi:hypothetical protein
MSPARRSRRRRDWPRGLYESKPGYFVWRHPDGMTFALGRVSFESARNQALAANAQILLQAPSLIERIEAREQPDRHTVAELIGMMPEPPKATSQRTYRSLYKAIQEGADGKGGIGSVFCDELTVKHCADVLEVIKTARGEHMAKGARARLVAICRRGCELGWMDANVADVTGDVRPKVVRSRLSLEQFLAIREKATGYLPRAMNLALVTGQDRSTIAAMLRTHVRDGRLICQRSKTDGTNAPIAIPLELRLEALGMSLADILNERTGVVCKHIVHHTAQAGPAKPGDPVGLDTISADFTAARRAAGIPDTLPDGKTAPTFHEIRSLAKRLYLQQGNVDTKQLLGHASDSSSELYANPRDREPVVVQITAK